MNEKRTWVRWCCVTMLLAMSACASPSGETPEKAAPSTEAKPQGEVASQADGDEWKLLFEDTFDRAEPGPDWSPVSGQWRVENGSLVGSGAIMTARGLPGGDAKAYLRIEFDAATTVKPLAFLQIGDQPAKPKVSDLSVFMNTRPSAGAKDLPLDAGYFFQFGGFHNTRNQLRRAGDYVVVDKQPAVKITPDKLHHIVVQNDRGQLSMTVDGQPVLSHTEQASIMGPGFERVGFYFYTEARIEQVKVYGQTLPGGMNHE